VALLNSIVSSLVLVVRHYLEHGYCWPITRMLLM